MIAIVAKLFLECSPSQLLRRSSGAKNCSLSTSHPSYEEDGQVLTGLSTRQRETPFGTCYFPRNLLQFAATQKGLNRRYYLCFLQHALQIEGGKEEEEHTQAGDAFETVSRLIDLWSNGI